LVHFSLKIRHLVATILMIFLRVLPKIFLWPHYSGPQELGGRSSSNRLNPRFLRHSYATGGTPLAGALNTQGWEKLAIFVLFSTEIAI